MPGTQIVSPVELQMLACPECNGALRLDNVTLRCNVCSADYHRGGSGCWDFRQGALFEDWFSLNEAAMQQFRETGAAAEHAGSTRVIDEYVLPLVRRLGLRPGEATILSDGCGIGVDVERLREHGYLAWGGDPGARSSEWAGRACAPYLVHLSGTRLPFASGSFDFVFSEGVIEHVGLSGDEPEQGGPDRARLEEERQQYCHEISRVLKPGGFALVAAPNRLFPIDFFHGGEPFLGMGWRFHSPNEPFLATAADVRRWFKARPSSVSAITLDGFFHTNAVARRGPLGKALELGWRTALRTMPPRLVDTIGPYFALLVRKPPLAQARPMAADSR
jgi:SAM-dependent methyltransferase